MLKNSGNFRIAT